MNEKKEDVENTDVILQLAVRNAFEGKDVRLNRVYLSDDIEHLIPPT